MFSTKSIRKKTQVKSFEPCEEVYQKRLCKA